MSKLCESCKRSFGEKRCFIPTTDENFSEWKKSRLVLNEDGSCDFYNEITFNDKAISYLKKTLLQIYSDIKDFVKYKIINQIKYGFDTRDCWDLGTSTANFILPRLRKFIDDDPMRCPSELTIIEYVHKHNLGKYYPTGSFNSDVGEASKAWVAILEKIYTSLEYASNRYDDKFDCFYENEYGERELDKHKSILLYDEISEGFRLFGLFFQDLWD